MKATDQQMAATVLAWEAKHKVVRWASTLPYDAYVAYTRVRDLVLRVMPTRVLVRWLVWAAMLERQYLAGAPHTADQYDRVSDLAVTLDTILARRARV